MILVREGKRVKSDSWEFHQNFTTGSECRLARGDKGMKSEGPTIIPSARYRDAHAAIEWLCRVLGFSKQTVFNGPDGTVAHAELTLGKGMVMLGSAANVSPYSQAMAHPDEIGRRATSPLYVVVEDCGAVYERVNAEGVEILQEMRTMEYGGRAFTIRDPEGYVWGVGEYDPWAAR
jgi:uncharacterized glyoxalase superfamily protein PhnB